MKKQILSFITFTLISIQAFSTHIVGSTLTYVYNGGSSYTFTLKLYRDCGAGSAASPGSVTINVRGLNGAVFAPTKDFTKAGGAITNIPSNLDTCAVPPNPLPCVQERIYSATVTNLPPNVGGYHCYYQVCCRNLSTTNVNAACNCIGSSVYTYIPGPTGVWLEDFTITHNEGSYQFILNYAKSNKPWLESLFARVTGKFWELPIPPQYDHYAQLLVELLASKALENNLVLPSKL